MKPTHEQPLLTGRQIIDAIVREYGQEVFISEGYAAGDALESAIDAAIARRCQNHPSVAAQLCRECLDHAAETGAYI